MNRTPGDEEEGDNDNNDETCCYFSVRSGPYNPYNLPVTMFQSAVYILGMIADQSQHTDGETFIEESAREKI